MIRKNNDPFKIMAAGEYRLYDTENLKNSTKTLLLRDSQLEQES